MIPSFDISTQTGAASIVMAGVFGVLVFATVLVMVLKRTKPAKDWSELGARIKTWWFIVVLFFSALLLGRTVSLIAFAFLSFLALKEYLSLIPTRRADRRVLLWTYLAIPAQYYLIHTGWYGMYSIFIPVYMFLFIPFRMVLIGETAGFLSAVGTLSWGLMTTVYSISYLAALLMLPYEDVTPPAGHSAGVPWVLFLVLLTELNDVMQYVWGKMLGRSKVVPSVSPGKTWAGLLGGAATTTAVSVLIGPLLTPMTRKESVGAGLIIGLFGFVGDITISAVKRDLHKKDSGNILPGHGGILDRVDSLTYTAPLFFHFLRYLHT